MNAFRILEDNVDPYLRSLTEDCWMDFREGLNELGRLQQETVRQLEGRWFIHSSYQELLNEAAGLAQRASEKALSIRDDVTGASLNTPEFNALVDHALAFAKRFSTHPACLFQISQPATPSATKGDLTL